MDLDLSWSHISKGSSCACLPFSGGQDGDDKLRVTVPKSVTTLGFRLQKWLVYEVVKGSWADSVGLNLGALVHRCPLSLLRRVTADDDLNDQGDRLQLLQQKKVTDWSKEQLKEAHPHSHNETCKFFKLYTETRFRPSCYYEDCV